MSITLRTATPDDVPQILALVRDLAAYEKMPDEAKATPEQLRRALFGDPARDGKGAGLAECVMGEVDGRVEGIAFFFMNYSTWTGQPGLYLEDLFVRPAARGRGLGKALLSRVAQIALERGFTRVDWLVLDWNESAIGFYKSLGAVALDNWTIFRLADRPLEQVAREG